MNMSNLNTHCCNKCSPIRQWLIERKLRKLKLDDSQRKKLDALIASARSATKDHFNAKDEVLQRITAMISEDGFNPAKTADLISVAAEQHADRAIDMADAFGDFYQGLEPWQREQILAMWQKRGHYSSRCCH